MVWRNQSPIRINVRAAALKTRVFCSFASFAGKRTEKEILQRPDSPLNPHKHAEKAHHDAYGQPSQTHCEAAGDVYLRGQWAVRISRRTVSRQKRVYAPSSVNNRGNVFYRVLKYENTYVLLSGHGSHDKIKL